jgi:Zinc carboxypeptidase
MSARRMRPIAALAVMLAIACNRSSNMTSTPPLTRAEQSAFEDTSRYADVRAFIDALTRQTPRVRVENFGRSEEGRDLPLLVVGEPPADAPPPRTDSRLPVVFVMANIHAGEVEGKEAVLHLARRLTLGDLQPLLRSAVWLFAPIYNADGNERVSLDNRSEQYGPVGGVGIRENAKGLDLNRDFMKLESSEARALVSLFTRWDPDVVVDLHTTNGSYHGYHLTYAPALNPNTDSRIDEFTRERLLPAVRRAMADRHHFRTYDYGNFAVAGSLDEELEGFGPDDRQKVWRTYDSRPRFGNNYIGLRNRIAILSEAYSYLSFERRVRATEAFVEEIMRFVAASPSDIGSLTNRVDREWTSSHTSAESGVAFALRPRPTPVDVLVGAIDMMVNQRSGKPMRIMIESVATPTSMTVYDGFLSTATRRVPAEYIVPVSPTGLHEVVERKLREHGILVERREVPSRASVEQFAIAQVRHADQLFQRHHATSVTGRFERRDVDVAPGSLVVRTNQPLGRLAFYLLEPESNDGLTTWNVLDSGLAAGGTHPILKSVR